jgi:hypothetical protein
MTSSFPPALRIAACPRIYVPRIQSRTFQGSNAVTTTQHSGYFESALSASRDRQAKVLALRIATSTARLRRNRGKADHAREVFAQNLRRGDMSSPMRPTLCPN